MLKSFRTLTSSTKTNIITWYLEQKQRFQALIPGGPVPGSTGAPGAAAAAATSIPNIALLKMGPQDDPNVFKHAEDLAKMVHLFLLLLGKAQLIALQLPVTNLLEDPELKQAILQWVGNTQ